MRLAWRCVLGESMRGDAKPGLSWITRMPNPVRAVTVGLAGMTGAWMAALSFQGALAQEVPDAAHGPQILAAVAAPAEAPAVRVIASTPLSPECASKSPAHEGARAFRRVYQAMQERRSARVLAIGSSSIVGVGASQPAATFTVQLEADLESAFKGADFDIIGRGVSGEIAEGTAARIRAEAMQLKPDLIVWQVGTNDGVAHADQAVFAALLTSTLRWLGSQRLDVVLIDPQYVGKFAGDES